MDEQKQRIVIRKTKPTLSREHRAGFTLVIIAGCFALVLGGFYLIRHITSPFFIEYSGEYYISQEEAHAIEIAEQQVKDTDGDGLTDYDELYLHGSSPYLKDTDGDGYNDDTEVLAGTNVNCSAGQDCSDVVEVSGSENLFVDIVPTGTSDADSDASLLDVQQAVSELSIEEIRELLITAGAEEEMLNEISDEELEVLFAEVMGEMENGEGF